MRVPHLLEWKRFVDKRLHAVPRQAPETVERRLRVRPDSDHRLTFQVERAQVDRNRVGHLGAGRHDHPSLASAPWTLGNIVADDVLSTAIAAPWPPVSSPTWLPNASSSVSSTASKPRSRSISRFQSLREVAMTRAPSALATSAVTRPRPDAAAVTSTQSPALSPTTENWVNATGPLNAMAAPCS